MPETGALLRFDGTCGFCAQSVQFVLRRERRRQTLRFAALDSSIGRELRARYPELEGVDSVIWVEPVAGSSVARLYVRSEAVFRVLEYLGGLWGVLARIGPIVPRVARDWVYDLVARHRHRLIRGGAASCLLPTPEQRSRFVDWDSQTA